MKRTIKSIVKLMSFGFIGLALLSCSKSETAPVNQDKAIGFNTYTGRTVTKADASLIDKGTQVLPNGAKFVVYAYNTGSASWAGTVSNVFMKNVTVTYAGGGATDATKYTYSPLRYWPNDEANNLLSFFAYYPANGDGIVPPAAATEGETSNGWGDYTFTVDTDPTKMVDFCVSEVAPNQKYSLTNHGNEGIVNMKFYHTLTMVKFQVKTDENPNANPPYVYTGTTITLKSITLAGVNTVGTLSPNNDHLTYDWSDATTPKEFNIFTSSEQNPGLIVNSTGAWLPSKTAVAEGTPGPAKDAYLMIPQTLSDNVKATIEYTVQTEGDDAVTNTAVVTLNTSDIKAWQKNKNIVYTFIVGLKPIKFIAEVADWDAVTGANFDIPVPTTTGN